MRNFVQQICTLKYNHKGKKGGGESCRWHLTGLLVIWLEFDQQGGETCGVMAKKRSQSQLLLQCKATDERGRQETRIRQSWHSRVYWLCAGRDTPLGYQKPPTLIVKTWLLVIAYGAYLRLPQLPTVANRRAVGVHERAWWWWWCCLTQHVQRHGGWCWMKWRGGRGHWCSAGNARGTRHGGGGVTGQGACGVSGPVRRLALDEVERREGVLNIDQGNVKKWQRTNKAGVQAERWEDKRKMMTDNGDVRGWKHADKGDVWAWHLANKHIEHKAQQHPIKLCHAGRMMGTW
ncbi:hypothetical protein FB451DRAFT_1359974 [Mycena latifolia]|nr:hypothetical protein FB451DRAFT_1359974 [Mycena latifolia]